MARLAKSRLCERVGGWDSRPFDADSTMHVSVYENPQLRPVRTLPIPLAGLNQVYALRMDPCPTATAARLAT